MNPRFAVGLLAVATSGCWCGQIPDLSQNFDAGSAGDAGVPADAGTDAGPLPPALAYWPLNEGSGTVVHDRSGNGNDGVLMAAGSDLPAWTQGPTDGGLSFSGDGGWVEFGMGDGGDFKITGSVTLSAWYWYPGVPDSGNDMPMVTKRGSPSRGWSLYLSDGSAVFDVSQNGVAYLAVYGPGVSARQWHKAVGVYDADAGTVSLYSDGLLSEPASFDAGAQFDSMWTVHFGTAGECGAAPGCGQVFSGILGEVRIWNRALTPDEVGRIP